MTGQPTQCRHFRGMQNPCEAGEAIPKREAMRALREQGYGLPCMRPCIKGTPAPCASRSWFTDDELAEQEREDARALADILGGRCPTCGKPLMKTEGSRVRWVCPDHGVVMSGRRSR